MPEPAPVTVVITRKVRPGREEEFERFVREWVPIAVTFPGYLGVHMLRPPPGGNDYGAVLRFRAASDWDAFREWPAYREFGAKIEPLIDGGVRIDTATGMEIWFTPPGSPPPVPQWKMAVVTWLGVNALTYSLGVTMMPFLMDHGVPFWATLVLTNAVVVAGLTWAVMPGLVWAFRKWLFG